MVSVLLSALVEGCFVSLKIVGTYFQCMVILKSSGKGTSCSQDLRELCIYEIIVLTVFIGISEMTVLHPVHEKTNLVNF